MSVPQSKNELLAAIQTTHDKLFADLVTVPLMRLPVKPHWKGMQREL